MARGTPAAGDASDAGTAPEQASAGGAGAGAPPAVDHRKVVEILMGMLGAGGPDDAGTQRSGRNAGEESCASRSEAGGAGATEDTDAKATPEEVEDPAAVAREEAALAEELAACADDAARCRALAARAAALRTRGRFARAAALYARQTAMLAEAAALGAALCNEGNCLLRAGDASGAAARFAQAQRAGDARSRCAALIGLAGVAEEQGRAAEAEARFREALAELDGAGAGADGGAEPACRRGEGTDEGALGAGEVGDEGVLGAGRESLLELEVDALDGLVELLFERAAGAAELAPLVERLTARAKAATAAAGGAVGVAELRARFQHVRLLDCQGEFAAALEAARALHARAGDNPALARDEMAPPRRAPLCPRPAHRRGVAAGGPARFWRCRGNGSKI